MGFVVSKNTVYMVVIVFVLLLISGTIFLVLSLDLSRETRIAKAEASILMKKMLYSSNCFAYEDVRVNPLTIDINKFNNKTAESCVDISKFSAQLILNYDDKTVEVINNENRFLVDKRLCDFKAYGCVNITQPVLVYDNGIKSGVLSIFATSQDV